MNTKSFPLLLTLSCTFPAIAQADIEEILGMGIAVRLLGVGVIDLRQDNEFYQLDLFK